MVRAKSRAYHIHPFRHPAPDGRGHFKKVKDSMVTGVTNTEEVHGIAVIRAKYDKKSVIFRIAFDPEMNLIGLDVRGK